MKSGWVNNSVKLQHQTVKKTVLMRSLEFTRAADVLDAGKHAPLQPIPWTWLTLTHPDRRLWIIQQALSSAPHSPVNFTSSPFPLSSYAIFCKSPVPLIILPNVAAREYPRDASTPMGGNKCCFGFLLTNIGQVFSPPRQKATLRSVERSFPPGRSENLVGLQPWVGLLHPCTKIAP